MKFYKKSTGEWVVGNFTIPAGSCVKDKQPLTGAIIIESMQGKIYADRVLPTEFEYPDPENAGQYLKYATVEDFETATQDFFFNVKPASGSYTRYIVPIEQIDGRLNIEVPNEVDLTKDTIVVEGKFTHTPDVDYTIENVAGKGNFTFTVAPTELTVIRYIKK